MAKKTDEKVVATLQMTVTFSSMIEMDTVREIVEKAREYGYPEKAVLTVHRSVSVDVSR